MKPTYHARQIRQAGKNLTNRRKLLSCARIEMNTTFTKLMKAHAPVNGYIAIWQRCSRPLGVVGTKS
jgi:hypothetical protein